MHDCHPITEQPKADRLEALYWASGRHEDGHPMKGLYTGLHAEDLDKTATQEQEPSNV